MKALNIALAFAPFLVLGVGLGEIIFTPKGTTHHTIGFFAITVVFIGVRVLIFGGKTKLYTSDEVDDLIRRAKS